MLFDDPNKLSNEEIREKLLTDNFDKDLVESIIEQFWFHDWGNSFVSYKKHFQILLNYLKDSKTSEFNRFDFYSYFFSNVVDNFQKKELYLQKLALVFELIQNNKLPLDDFEKTISTIDSNHKLTLKELLANELILINTEDGKEKVEWTHHTLSEYLAATYILSKNNLEELERFMIYADSGLTSFIPSWSGAFRFLIEKESDKYVDWIIKFLKENPTSLDDSLAETIVFATPVTLDKKLQNELFRIIFDSYQEKKWWIPVWVYHNIFKMIDKDIYEELKNTLQNENLIIRGNIIAVLDGMIQNNHNHISKEEIQWWKAEFIKNANAEDEVGVIRRHSLAALKNYKGEKDIINKVESNFYHSDSLVREAFINTCKDIDPNSSEAIKFFIKAIAEDSVHIYARHALYSITSKEGINNFLKGISKNRDFIYFFIEKESIFNKKEEQADQPLIDCIKKYIDKDNVEAIKEIILLAFIKDRNYDAGKSYFLQQLTSIIKSQDSNYLFELIEVIKALPEENKKHVFTNDIEGIIAVLLNPDVIDKLNIIFTSDLHSHAAYTFAEAIRLTKDVGNPNSDEIYKKGIELKIIAEPSKQQYIDYEKKQQDKIYKQFVDYLNPPIEGQYYPQVFRYFIDNQKLIEQYWKDDQREKLLHFAIRSNLEKIEPERIKVRYKDKEIKTGQYVISSVAGHFGDVLQVIYTLQPSVFKEQVNRQKVINFIPYLYGSDYQVVEKIIGELKDEELYKVNDIMLDKNNDARYLIPQTYIYFADKYSYLQSTKKVLMSIIDDSLFSESDREYAMRTLAKQLSKNSADEKFIEAFWNSDTLNLLSNTANAILITTFHNKKAIEWRFEKIKSNAKPFHSQKGFHSVGNFELELSSMAFAKPLIELSEEKYLDGFIDLLEFSLKFVKESGYQEYVNYIWKIVIRFVIRDGFLLSHSSLHKLREWIEKHQDSSDINWFNKRLETTIVESMTALTKQKSPLEALDFIKKSYDG